MKVKEEKNEIKTKCFFYNKTIIFFNKEKGN